MVRGGLLFQDQQRTFRNMSYLCIPHYTVSVSARDLYFSFLSVNHLTVTVKWILKMQEDTFTIANWKYSHI